MTDEIFLEKDEGTPDDLVRKIKEKLKKCEAEKGEYLTGWQRAKADFINARREEEERRGDFMKFSEKELILRFLGLADGFDRLFADKKWIERNEPLKQGVKNLHSQLVDILKKRKVEIMDAIGKTFNPHEHESAGEVGVDKLEKEGIVIEELRKGYKMHGVVIRPALVKISKHL